MWTAVQPATQHLPMPLATTAAWEVIPPRAVRIPWAACIPPMSSGDVSVRTRTTFSPLRAAFSASSAVKTTLPTAAPGDAGSPFAMTFTGVFGSKDGCIRRSSCSGSIRMIAVFLSISLSLTMSMAIFSDAAAVRLPTRVCSMYSLPSWTVNSMSSMSL